MIGNIIFRYFIGNQQERRRADPESQNSALHCIMKFQVICDSSADLPREYAREHGVTVVPYYVSLDDTHYLREGIDISIPDFYQAMIDHSDCFPKTSMPTITDYMDAMRPSVEAGIPVLCICLTSVFSGSIQSAGNAAAALREQYPNASITVLDSQCVTALEGVFVMEAIRLRDADLTLEQAVPKLEAIRSTGRIFFTTKDLKYLQHGGRLSKAASMAGSLLNLKPILCFHGGDLDAPEICRGRRKSLQKILDNFFAYLKENSIDLKGYHFATGIGAELPEYQEFREMLKQRLDAAGITPDEWLDARIGATIGVHTGPYPMGLGLLKKCDSQRLLEPQKPVPAVFYTFQ